jgi:DNA-binding MarR family transcriptional regulator
MAATRTHIVAWQSSDATGETGDKFVIDESLGYLVNALARAFARALSTRIASHGVTPAQWAVLLVLWAEDGPTQTALSRRVAIETPTMVRTLDRMERDHLVTRRRNVRDRRQVNVFLTERGRALRDKLVPSAVAVNEAATRGFDDAERSHAVDLMARMLANLAAPSDRGSEGHD